MKKFILPLFLVLFSANQTLQADIYKWTDKDGKVHYSATPPKEPQKDIENIGNKIKANIGKVQDPTTYKAPELTSDEATDDKKDKVTDKKPEDIYAGDRSPARIAYCNSLKSNIHTMQDNKGKIVKKGSTEPLTQQQIAEQLKKDKAKLATNCIGI